MARKPKDIWDIVDKVNDVFSKNDRPSDEFYGGSLGDFKDAVKNAAQFSAQAANPVLESYARNVALPQAGGKPANWKGFAAEQALGAAAIGGSLAAAKIAQQTGISARVSNIVRGKEIMVHGSPVRDLKVIEPRPARFNPDVPAIYGISTTMPANRRSSIGVTSVTSGYAQGSNWMESVYGPKPAGGGSIYAVEVPRSSIKRPYDEIIKKAPRIINRSQAPMVYSEKPGKVVGEVKLEWRTVEEINNDVKKMLRQAGAPSQDPLINKVKENLAKKVAKKPTKGRF